MQTKSKNILTKKQFEILNFLNIKYRKAVLSFKPTKTIKFKFPDTDTDRFTCNFDTMKGVYQWYGSGCYVYYNDKNKTMYYYKKEDCNGII